MRSLVPSTNPYWVMSRFHVSLPDTVLGITVDFTRSLRIANGYFQ